MFALKKIENRKNKMFEALVGFGKVCMRILCNKFAQPSTVAMVFPSPFTKFDSVRGNRQMQRPKSHNLFENIALSIIHLNTIDLQEVT